jgi:hypothetical protein
MGGQDRTHMDIGRPRVYSYHIILTYVKTENDAGAVGIPLSLLSVANSVDGLRINIDIDIRDIQHCPISHPYDVSLSILRVTYSFCVVWTISDTA